MEYKGHFCLGCSVPPPGGVHGWVRGYGGVGLWEAGPGCACCEDYDWESLRVWGVGFFLFDISQLHGAATGGIGDSFVDLLPRILWCWVSFARAFLLALPREASLVALTDPINNQTSGPSTLTFDFDRTDHRSTSGRRSFIFETCS